MLGKTAGGLFWMFRYLERSENTARLIDAGLRIALTRSRQGGDDWGSVVTTAGVRDAFLQQHESYQQSYAVDFLLRDTSNPSSVLSVIGEARNNARLVRTALTREVWEATNECWMTLSDTLARPVRERELPAVLNVIRKQSALVRGAMTGTMLRNDCYNFARIGTFLERADNTARILDVKYYVLLPSTLSVGSSLDNVQWEVILRSVSAERAYRWLNEPGSGAAGIAEFLMLDSHMPRSLAFCHGKIVNNLRHLARDYGERPPCLNYAERISERFEVSSIGAIFDAGLHEFIEQFIADSNTLGQLIEQDYRFYS